MLRYATPLMFASLGGLFSERSGVVNIGLEGMMLVGAFFSVWGTDVTGTWYLGLAIGIGSRGMSAGEAVRTYYEQRTIYGEKLAYFGAL